ncbi:MAG: alpha/beta fold hydrolase [Thermofilaceae archaeon]
MKGERFLNLYCYNKELPLNPEKELLKEEDKYIAYMLRYDSIGTRVPALLALPRGEGPHPCLVFLHGHGGRKEDGLYVAEAVSPRGYAVFSIDAPCHGERGDPSEYFNPDLEKLKGNFIQTVLDLMRGLDYIESLKEVDSSRIGYLGGSMGGILGALFTSLDTRVKASVILVGGGDLPLLLWLSKHPAAERIRKRITSMGLSYEQMAEITAPGDPLNFIHLHSPRPIQFHCGRYDEIVPAVTQKKLVEAAGEPKEVHWYDAGHALPLEAVSKRVLEFFEQYLKPLKLE